MAGLMAPTSLNVRQSFAGTSVGLRHTASLSQNVLRTPIRMAQSLQVRALYGCGDADRKLLLPQEQEGDRAGFCCS